MKIKLIFLSLMLLTFSNESISQNWQPLITLPGSGTTSMKMNSAGDLFFTTASFNFPSGQTAGVYRLLNGTSLMALINPTGGTAFNSRTVETEGGNSVWASFWGNPSAMTEGLYYSTNKGDSWTNTFSIGTGNNIFSIKADPDNDNVYLGARNGVYKSTNNGLNFSLSNTGMAPNSWTYDIEKAGNTLLAATSIGVYKSLDAGSNWSMVNGITPNDTPKVISVFNSASGTKVYIGTSRGAIYISDVQVLDLISVYSFLSSNIIAMLILENNFNQALRHLYVSAFPQNFDQLGNGLFYSGSSDTGWTNFDAGLPLPYKVSAMGGRIVGNVITLFAGTFNNMSNGVRIFKNEYTVGINNISTAVPEKYSLSQNYPNPFNPTTKIRFEIQKDSEVKLVVYNSLGKEISTLVNKNLNAGTYETDFNGEGHSSGVYFYKLFISGEKNFIETRKMILTK